MGFPHLGPIFGGFSPPTTPNLKIHQRDPSKALPANKTRILSYHTSGSVNRCDLYAWRRNRIKKKTKLFERQLHPSRWVSSPYRILTKFGTHSHLPYVITCAKFHFNPFAHFGSARGQTFHFPLWKHCRLYNSLALPGWLWLLARKGTEFTAQLFKMTLMSVNTCSRIELISPTFFARIHIS